MLAYWCSVNVLLFCCLFQSTAQGQSNTWQSKQAAFILIGSKLRRCNAEDPSQRVGLRVLYMPFNHIVLNNNNYRAPCYHNKTGTFCSTLQLTRHIYISRGSSLLGQCNNPNRHLPYLHVPFAMRTHLCRLPSPNMMAGNSCNKKFYQNFLLSRVTDTV